jgi:hypothetical protein
MKKNLVFAGLLFVTGVSQMTAQEKEGKSLKLPLLQNLLNNCTKPEKTYNSLLLKI